MYVYKLYFCLFIYFKIYFHDIGEMARRGVTQELIDETRASTEVQMLRDLQKIASLGGDLEYKDHQGATPVCIVKQKHESKRIRSVKLYPRPYSYTIIFITASYCIGEWLFKSRGISSGSTCINRCRG